MRVLVLATLLMLALSAPQASATGCWSESVNYCIDLAQAAANGAIDDAQEAYDRVLYGLCLTMDPPPSWC